MQLTSIGELCDFSNGHGFAATEWKASGLPIIRIQNLNGSRNFNYFSGVADQDWLVNPGDLLFAWAGVKGVSFGPTIWNGPVGVLNQHIYRIRPHAGVSKQWLFHALVRVTAEIERNAHGFKTNLVHVRKSDISDAEVVFPSLKEQERVASVLDTWDLAIGCMERLIAAKDRAYRGLIQQEIHGDSYPKMALSQLVDRVSRKNANGNGHPLTISGRDGLVSQSMFFDKRIAPDSTEHYTLLKRGEFAYNKSYSSGYPYGAIKRLDAFDEGIVSSLYLCFCLKPDAPLLSDYLVSFCETGGFNRQIHMIAQEGARNHGLLNVSASDFFAMTLLLPPIPHQKRVIELQSTTGTELLLLREQLNQLKKQKRGLVQKLFSEPFKPIAGTKEA